MPMEIFCAIGFAVIFLYSAYIWWKRKEMPQSISATVYDLDIKRKWVFTAVMFLVTFMIVPQMIEKASENTKFLAFLTCGGILGVGADPLCHNEEHPIHYVSAIIMGVSSQVLVGLNEPWFLVTWAPYIVYTLYKTDGTKNMFIGEMSMLANVAAYALK